MVKQMKKKPRNIQRTVLMALGTLAQEIAALLPSRLGTAGAAMAVIVASNDESLNGTRGQEERYPTALREISLARRHQLLARDGWQLDRLDEIAFIVLIDLDEAQAVGQAGTAVATMTSQAEQLLGVSVAALCVAITAHPENPANQVNVAALAKPGNPFSRGVMVLGTINELGFCLPGEAELADIVLDLLYTLIATPLRDVPEWLPASPVQLHSSALLSMGISTWAWDSNLEREVLALNWVRQALTAWRAKEVVTTPISELVENWFGRQELEPEQLTRRLGASNDAPLIARRLVRPWPWQLSECYKPLCEPVGPQLNSTRVAAASEEVVTQATEALWAWAVELLDSTPNGGLDLLQRCLVALRLSLSARQDRLTGRQLVQAERETALLAQREEVISQLTAHLAEWPPTTRLRWAGVLARPWRWPGLVVRYWQMQQLAVILEQLNRECAQWRRQQELDDRADEIYVALAGATGRLQCQAEEVADMLTHLQFRLREEAEELLEDAPFSDKYLAGRLAQLTPETVAEATIAASAAGGLGRQLAAIDDSIVEQMRLTGRERLVRAESFSAVAALEALYDTPAKRAAWWEEMMATAAPLWRYDETAQTEQGRLQNPTLTVVAAADVARLRESLALADAPGLRWVEMPSDHITVLQLRGALPV